MTSRTVPSRSCHRSTAAMSTSNPLQSSPRLIISLMCSNPCDADAHVKTEEVKTIQDFAWVAPSLLSDVGRSFLFVCRLHVFCRLPPLFTSRDLSQHSHNLLTTSLNAKHTHRTRLHHRLLQWQRTMAPRSSRTLVHAAPIVCRRHLQLSACSNTSCTEPRTTSRCSTMQ